MLKTQSLYFLLLTFLILLIAGSCSGNIANSTPTIQELESTSTQTITDPTATTEIETPSESKNLFILLQETENYLDSEKLELITDAAKENGYLVSVSEDLPENTNASSTILIFTQTEQILNHVSGISKERLIIIGDELINPALENLVFIQTSKAKQIFIAGFLAALITEDWRVGGLLPDIKFYNTDATTVFSNGVKYLCGRCTPVYGPIVNFPVTSKLSSPEDNERTMEAFGEIASSRIKSVFIPGEYLYDDLVILLRQNDVNILSDTNLVSSNDSWVDYVVTNNLSKIIIDILSEKANNNELNESIVVEYSIQTNSMEIPLGRANFLQEMINDLQSGLISPFETTTD